MNKNEWWPQYIENAAQVALTSISKIYCNSSVYTDSTFYFFFVYIVQKYKIQLNVLSLDKPMQRMKDDDSVVVIGPPNEILHFTQNISRDCLVIYLSVPVASSSFKFNVLGQPVNAIKFGGFCLPFVPRKKCLYLPIGNFSHFFLEQNSYHVKALKAAIAATAHIFGGFNRVYGVGELSSKVASGVIDALSKDIPRMNNNLVVLDRTLDMETPLRFNETYIGFIEELYPFEEFDLEIPGPAQQPIFGRITPVTSVDDMIFNDIAVMSLPEVRRRLEVTNLGTVFSNELKNHHSSLVNNIENRMKVCYPKELFLDVQHKEKDPITQARILGIGETGSILAFRALSVLRAQGENKKAEQYGRFLGQAFGVPAVAKWARIDGFLQNIPKVDVPSTQLSSRIGPLVATFAQIIADQWKRPKFPVQPNYVYTSTPLVNEPQRWFVVIPGGLCGTELALMRSLAKNIRPNDQFVFMPTNMYSPDKLMAEILH